MDEGWSWSLETPVGGDGEPNPIEIDDTTMSEYQAAISKYHEIQEHLEHMYRHQRNLRAFVGSPYHENPKHRRPT